MVREVTRWLAKDNTLHNSAYDARRHEFTITVGLTCFECPQCKGKSTINGEPITERVNDREADAWAGAMYPMNFKDVIVGYKQVECDVCNGKGFTPTQKQPITKTEIIGWK